MSCLIANRESKCTLPSTKENELKEKESEHFFPPNKNIEKPIITEKINKKDYEEIGKMKDYLSEECNMFNENFEVVKYLDSGSEGIFYEGKMKKLNKTVGLKFILKNDKDKKSNMEISLHSRLKHKNIINLYAQLPIKFDSSCIVMEFGKYGNLKDLLRKLLKRKILSETFLCFIAKQILEGLKYCHNSKVAHFDIKPQNILIDELLNIKISDFSISFNYKHLPSDGDIKLPFAGTSLYMAPEVLRNTGYIKVEELNKIDIYSLGVLLYNLAYGEFPYDVKYDNYKAYNIIYYKIMHNQLIFPEKVKSSSLFNNFLTKLLSNNIKNRYSIEQALNDPWIKASDIIFEEKEKLCNLEKFVVFVVTDSIKKFNDKIKELSQKK